MKALAFALICATQAQAGTVYVDRPLPLGGTPCLVAFAGVEINASMIQDVQAGTYSTYVHADSWWNPQWNEVRYKAVRVSLVNKSYYEVRGEDLKELERQKSAFIEYVRYSCGSVK